MRSQSNSNKLKSKSFILKWWHFLIIFFVALIMLYFVFPEQILINHLKDTKPNAVSLSYLKNLSEKNPNEPMYKILLANQELSLGNIDAAEKLIKPYLSVKPSSKIEWEALCSNYLIVRTKTYALKEKSSKRLAKEVELKKLISALSYSNYLNADQSLLLAKDAEALGLIKNAVEFYQHLAQLADSPNASAEYLAKAGKIALYSSDYRTSAKMYFLAQDRSIGNSIKKNYFLSGLRSLENGNLDEEALNTAQNRAKAFYDDREVLQYLARLALSANKPDVALRYINQMLQLEHWSS